MQQRSDALQAMLSRAEERFKPYSEGKHYATCVQDNGRGRLAALRKKKPHPRMSVSSVRKLTTYGELRKQHEAAQSKLPLKL